MKRLCISFAVILIIILAFSQIPTKQENSQYLRIHIRANSNASVDQQIKLEIRDLVVNFLAKDIACIHSKEDAMKLIESKKSAVNGLIDGFLQQKGFNYSANVKICKEEFPSRQYEDVTLSAGYYDAVIIELGKAEGDNWWCVVFPPLCWTDTSVKYKSKILEIIDDFFNINNKEE